MWKQVFSHTILLEISKTVLQLIVSKAFLLLSTAYRPGICDAHTERYFYGYKRANTDKKHPIQQTISNQYET